MWLIPTLSRPEKMQRLLDSMSVRDKAEEFVVVYWQGDPRLKHYERVEYPPHWREAVTPCEWVRDKVNWFFREYPNETFYSGLSDDLIMTTQDSLPAWREATGEWNLTWTDDGWAGKNMCAHPAFGGSLARSLAKAMGGHLAHPRFPHYGHEMVAFWVASELSLTKFLPQYQYETRHPLRGMREEDDETYRKCRALNQASYADFMNFPRAELDYLIASVRADMDGGPASNRTIMAGIVSDLQKYPAPPHVKRGFMY